MKKLSLLVAAFLSGVAVFAAEIPDFSKAETWKKSGWSKSVYTRAENGVLRIERTLTGSGAWCSVPFAVAPGEKISGTIDIAYLSQEDKGSARLGLNFLNAEGKRVLFRNVAQVVSVNGGFETKKFSFAVPAGTASVSVYVCVDGKGKAEFRNLIINK